MQSANKSSSRSRTHVLHTPALLGLSFRFINQQERIQAAQVSKIFLAACSCASSWSCEGALQGLLSEPFRVSETFLKENDNVAANHFNAPFIEKLPASKLVHARSSSMFAEARCVDILYNFEAGESNWRITRFFELLCSCTKLEHLALRMRQFNIPKEQLTNIKFPASLKSCLISFASAAENPLPGLLPVLPSSLRTLAIRIIGKEKCPFEFNIARTLQRLPQLQTLMLLDEIGRPLRLPELQEDQGEVDAGSDWGLVLPSLRIYTNLNVSRILLDIEKIAQMPSPPSRSLQTQFCASLSQLFVRDFSELTSDLLSAAVDWAAYLPHLTSLRVSVFYFLPRNEQVPLLPKSIGDRITTLVIDKVTVRSSDYESKNSDWTGCFSKHGMENLTSLSIKYHPANLHMLNDLTSLTYLSLSKTSVETFKMLSHLPKLKHLEMGAWPVKLLQMNPVERQWGNLDEDIGFCLSTPFHYGISPTNDNIQQNESISLAEYFPSLTQIAVDHDHENSRQSRHELSQVRSYLRSIPHLKLVRWNGSEVHPDELDPYSMFNVLFERAAKKERTGEMYDRSLSKYNNAIAGMVSAYINTNNVATTSSSMQNVSTVARHFNLFNLSLAFQSLSLPELAQASAVSKHWHSAALSPLVLRHHIRVEIHQLQGARVHGPQMRITNMWPMLQACKSAVCRNVRILTLNYRRFDSFMGESTFSSRFLRLFAKIPNFNRLHTLALNWSDPLVHYAFFAQDYPIAEDFQLIRRVMESDALKYLKVFRIMAPRYLIYLMLPFLPKSVETVELRYALVTTKCLQLETVEALKYPHFLRFAKPLQQLPMLKQLYICSYECEDIDHTFKDESLEIYHLEELQRFCAGVAANNQRFEEVLWRIPLSESSLKMISERFRQESTFVFPHLRSIHIPQLNGSLDALIDASAAMPHLSEVSIGTISIHPSVRPIRPLPESLCLRLRSLKLKMEASIQHHTHSGEALVRCLSQSKLPQLECLHLIRGVSPHGASSDVAPEVDSILSDLVAKILNACDHLTELHCSSINLDGSLWDRILPRLRVVYGNRAVLARLDQCEQMREYHTPRRLAKETLLKLVKLPYFESVTYSTSSQVSVQTRVQIAQRVKVSKLIDPFRMDDNMDHNIEFPSRSQATSTRTVTASLKDDTDLESDEQLAAILTSLAAN